MSKSGKVRLDVTDDIAGSNETVTMEVLLALFFDSGGNLKKRG